LKLAPYSQPVTAFPVMGRGGRFFFRRSPVNPLFTELRGRVPANKFYPPHLDPEQYLYRGRLVEEILKGKGRSRRILLIEAQAGQGKTTLAAQILEQASARFAWYQVGPEDGDPILFLIALLACLMNGRPGFRSPLLEEMIRRGEISPLELLRYANLLLADLDRHLRKEFWLVLDDLHLLEGAEASMGLLGHILNMAPPKVRFLLVARRPVGIELPALRCGKEIFRVGNPELALTRAEIAELFHDVLHIPLSVAKVRELHKVTEGWAMGLMLVGQTLERGEPSFSLKAAGREHLLEYFKSEVLAQVPSTLRRTLLRLCWLDRVPEALAERLSDVPNVRGKLLALSRRNGFLRQLDGEGTVFRFHHLFQDFLQEAARRELTREEIGEILDQAAAFCLEHHIPESAMGYYLKAGNFEALERVLETEGMALFGMGRTGTLMGILKGVPEETVRRRGYLSLFFGLALLNEDPPRALPHLQRAREVFEEGRNEVGELLALCQMINFLLYISCEYDQGTPLLRRAEEIYEKIRHLLDDRFQIEVLLNLAGGHSYFEGELDAACSFAQRALDLAEKHRLNSQVVIARFLIGMTNCFAGRWRVLIEEIEKTFIISGNPHLGSLIKLWLFYMALNYYAVSGDVEKFCRLADHSRETLKWNLVAGSAAEPFNVLFENDGWLGRGEIQKARGLVEKGLSLGMAAANSHLRSQFLHYQAYIASLSGNRETAISAAEESLRLRHLAGGKVFITLNEMIIGGTFAQLGMKEEAEAHLAKAIEGSEDLKEKFLRAGAFAHRAYLKLKTGASLEALEDIRGCLQCMGESNYTHFFSWTPQVMEPVLEMAVRYGIDVDYARYLAAERLNVAILEDGEIIPLLRIRALGGLAIAVGETVVLKAQDLTRGQRDLLAHLAAAPGQKLDQEKLQSDLWPESSSAKARSNLDSLLLRLRKLLDRALAPHSSRDYLSLQKGIVCLENCRIDAVEFAKKARKGLQHYRRNEFWQAGNCFYSAHQRWNGTFLPGGPSADAVREYRDYLDRLFVESSMAWGKILEKTGQIEEAIQVITKALVSHRTNDDLVRALYNLHIENGSAVKARTVLKDYREALRQEEFAPEEIEEIVHFVIFPSSA
jgi:LuxR family maltose regulon positive regulatory protein